MFASVLECSAHIDRLCRLLLCKHAYMVKEHEYAYLPVLHHSPNRYRDPRFLYCAILSRYPNKVD